MNIQAKLVSSQECLERYYMVTGSQQELLEDDMRIHIADCVDLLKVPVILKQNVIGSKQDPAYKFTNWSVPVPCNFVSLVPAGIMVNGRPTRWRENSFHYLLDGDCCDLESLNTVSPDIFLDNFGNEFSPQVGSRDANFQDVTWDIFNDKITFSVKEGDVCIAYYTLLTDTDGWLMIPDTTRFKRAVTNYLVWANDYILWRQGAISDKVYKESKDERDWAIASASSELKIPDIDQLESMYHTLVRFIPIQNGYRTFFKRFGVPERIRTS